MGLTYNVYCDESCHLQFDGKKKMFLGSVWCPTDKTKEISARIQELKVRHGIGHYVELKWTKVSANKLQFYIDLIDYFFDDDDLHFRGLVLDGKESLDHGKYNQTHDEWYYKMYFNLIKVILDPSNKYRIYLDIKDTNSAAAFRLTSCSNSGWMVIHCRDSNRWRVLKAIDLAVAVVAIN